MKTTCSMYKVKKTYYNKSCIKKKCNKETIAFSELKKKVLTTILSLGRIF